MTRQREGAVDKAHYLVLDGVKGNFIRMNATSQRPIRLEWYGYRTWKGNQLFISISLRASPNRHVDRQQELMNILRSIRFSAGKN
jgi:hypothetical protein